MNIHTSKLAMRALVVAIQTALLVVGAGGVAYAQDDSSASAAAVDETTQELDPVLQLTQPKNYVEIGAGYSSDDSYKFGAFNGLQDKGFFGVLNFLFDGGASYDSNDATRWTVVGTNLGLDSREVKAEYGEQGKFRLDFGYDELRRNFSDTYQTPYQGVGSSVLTLPSNWIQPRVPHVSSSGLNFRSLVPALSQGPALVGGRLVQPTEAQLAQMNEIIANDLPAFHRVPLDTQRQRASAGFSVQLSPNWGVKVSAQTEDKDGLRAQNSVTSLVREFAAVLPEKVDQNTQQYNVSLNYAADKAHMEFGYYGSIYDNKVKSMTWQDISDLSAFSNMSTTPSNEFHQFTVTGGYQFAPRTNLVINAGYARNTQNDTFLTNSTLPLGNPVNSLDGLVVTRSFNAKFTTRPMQGMNLNLGYKFDDRDNRTPVETYIFQDINEARSSAASAFNEALGLPANTLGSNINIYANRPYSKKLNQVDAGGDYAFAPGQVLRAAYQYQQIERGCDGSWINCVDAPKTREHLGQLEWRSAMGQSLNTSLSYTYSERSVNYDENAFLALVPMANFVPTGGATISVYEYLRSTGLTAFGPNLGYPTVPLTGNAAIYSPNNSRVPQALYGSRNNINELLGLRRFNMADRNRDKVRAKFDWQASELVSIYGSVDYNRDDYNHSLYGLTGSKQWAFNLDTSYQFSDSASANVFYTFEDRETDSAGKGYGNNSNTAFVGIAANTGVAGGCYPTVQERNNNAVIDPCLDWASNSRDKVHTFGFGLGFKDLMDGRLRLTGDLVSSRARTKIDVTGGSYSNNPFAASGQPAVDPAVYYIPATRLPTVVTNTVEFRLNAAWRLNAVSDLRMFYVFAHLKGTDYLYDGLQPGGLNIVIPDYESTQSYNVNVIGVAYNYHW
jgi:MtrB/PioB family decaheme-associated outer membrane protein